MEGEFTLGPSDHGAGEAIAYHVHQRPPHVHQCVNSKNHRRRHASSRPGSRISVVGITDRSFAYTPAADTVLTAGTQTLSLTFTPTDSTDYTTQTATTTITVSKATPTITWPTPASIAYGTPLSATQLDATASVPGSFVYSPVVGTVLAGGAHTLYATFK